MSCPPSHPAGSGGYGYPAGNSIRLVRRVCPGRCPRTTCYRPRGCPYVVVKPRWGLCLFGAVLAEQTDEWAEGHRYLGPELLARSRMHLLGGNNTGTETKKHGN